MANSEYIFNYLNDVWDLLPEKDRLRFAELWKGYEQSMGSVWMKLFERDMATNIDTLPLYNVQRWLKHMFDDTTQILRSATYRCNQDLSKGVNLSNRFLIKLSVDSDPAVEIDLRGVNPAATTIFEIVDRINQVVGKKVVFPVEQNQLIEFRSPTKGPGSLLTFYPTSSPANDASAMILGLDPDFDLPKTFPKFKYEYLLADQFIVGIPSLQDKIHDELTTVLLTENVDYEIEFGTGVISFAATPPAAMWAKDTLVNLETPYNNYGYLLDIYDKNTESYLKAVKGLWYAFWTGPRPENIRRSLYLLFGLPTASAAGTVIKVTSSVIEVRYDDNTTESFQIPTELVAIVGEFQRVERFQPLVDGIVVYDKINYPGFLEKEVGRFGVQPFLTEKATHGEDPSTDESKALRILEENTYLPQINVNAFISPDISLTNVQSFLKNIQPKSRSFLFQILVGIFRDRLDILDEGYRGMVSPNYPNGIPSLGFDITFDVTPNVDWNNNTSGNQDTWNEAEANEGTGLILDSEGMCFGDKIEIEVRQASVLTDSFSVEG